MIALRSLGLLAPVLLFGCATGCPPPGYPSPINERCTYTLKVTHVDAGSNEVKATSGRFYPKSFWPWDSEIRGYGEGSKDEEFSFRVKDIDKLVNTNQLQANNQLYLFTGFSGSAYLELYTSDTKTKALKYLDDQEKK